MAKTEFLKMFEKLCAEHSLSMSRACKEIGLASSLQTNWKKGYLPSAATQKKIADYFNITVDELMQRDVDGVVEAISEDQLELLKAYTKLDDEDRKLALRLINLLSKE